MSFRVLHVIDCYLPETMNWFEGLLNSNRRECEHHIFAFHFISKRNPDFHFVDAGIDSEYPISLFSKLKSRFYFTQTCKSLATYIREKSIQIIHFHFGHVAIRFMKWIQEIQLPFCISLYGFDYEYLVHKNPDTKTAYLSLSRLGARFIVEGKYSANVIFNYGIPRQQIYKLHMLFDRKMATAFYNFGEPIRLLQASTFTEKKNQLGLIEALQNRHQSRFVISFYGEKPDKNYFKEVLKAKQSKENHCIRISDKIPLQKYLDELRNTHFVISLSKYSKLKDSEGGCPVLLKDALCAGKPVISTKHCDIPEIIVHGFNGYLLEEDDSSAISELLDEILMLSQKRYSNFCLNAKQSVEANALQNISSTELCSIYSSML